MLLRWMASLRVPFSLVGKGLESVFNMFQKWETSMQDLEEFN
jgi:hypothetical protein